MKGNNNNLEEAVNAYFTNPDPARFEVGNPPFNLYLEKVLTVETQETTSPNAMERKRVFQRSLWRGQICLQSPLSVAKIDLIVM